jgi:hypothetical protein
LVGIGVGCFILGYKGGLVWLLDQHSCCRCSQERKGQQPGSRPRLQLNCAALSTSTLFGCGKATAI